jgi:hypothetical protein
MNRRDAMEVGEHFGSELHTDSLAGETMTRILDSSPETWRISQPGGGARMFLW